jgi:hypothetical protein
VVKGRFGPRLNTFKEFEATKIIEQLSILNCIHPEEENVDNNIVSHNELEASQYRHFPNS